MSTSDTSEFAALLDELIARGAEPQPVASSANIDLFALLDELDAARAAITADGVVAEYFEAAANVRFVPEAPPLAPEIIYPETTPEAVEKELGLKGNETHADLDARRRRFALANHPDRVAQDLRSHAMIRMQIANHLIDDAKRRLSARDDGWRQPGKKTPGR